MFQNLEFNGKQFSGGIDFGTEDQPECLKPELATDALVFMAVSQKWKVKIPLGFFLINRLNP